MIVGNEINHGDIITYTTLQKALNTKLVDEKISLTIQITI